ncbi:ACP phosphodiesterase [Christiangramia aquimixticola]|uniref:acyl carrier protein phosphodiesterase n=1 Tax=Christiangramia aquimixticola TaxID=1697558 RepID=UPI003AA8D57E
MNFLAHIFLSGDNEKIRIGNFMADSIKGNKYLKYPPDIQKGIILHRGIDYFTDTHPVFRESTQRLSSRYGHYSGIIVDIFYDHFLAANWAEYSDIALERYVDNFYSLLKENYEILPPKVKSFLPYMMRDNWLLSYAEIDGIKKVLNGMNKRTGSKSGMNEATVELQKYYPEFALEFKRFFEDAQLFCKEKRRQL